VLENLKSLDDVEEDLIGFSELHEEDQERVKAALEEGHVSESEEPEGYSMETIFLLIFFLGCSVSIDRLTLISHMTVTRKRRRRKRKRQKSQSLRPKLLVKRPPPKKKMMLRQSPRKQPKQRLKMKIKKSLNLRSAVASLLLPRTTAKTLPSQLLRRERMTPRTKSPRQARGSLPGRPPPPNVIIVCYWFFFISIANELHKKGLTIQTK